MEAIKMAKNAMKTLKQSQRAVAQREGIHIPTWTGQNGNAGLIQESSKPPTKIKTLSRNHSASQNLLSRIRSHQLEAHQKKIDRGNAKRKRILSIEELAEELHAYLQKRNRKSATTDQILSEFSSLVSSQNKLAFREVLRSMATCSNRVWTLKV